MLDISYLTDALLLVLIGLTVGWLTKDMIQEGYMSRQGKRAKWKTDKGEFEDGVSHLLHALKTTGKVSVGGIDRIVHDLQKMGYKDIGYEPNYGKPFYVGPAPSPTGSKLKSQIKGRLGPTWRTLLDKLKRRQKKPTSADPYAGIAEFRRKAS